MAENVKDKFVFDKDFPITFCPMCGSQHLTTSGIKDALFNRHRWDIYCNTCNWSFIIFLDEQGKTKFKYRLDSDMCKECQGD